MRTDLGLGKSPPIWRTLTRNCVKLAYKISRLMRVFLNEHQRNRAKFDRRTTAMWYLCQGHAETPSTLASQQNNSTAVMF
eukprot:scaffold13670_cov55-Cyclotella_meneghiniana.AAC.3